MAIKPEHIINLKGKQFVLFAGLLAEAHANGLIAIETEVQTHLSDPKEQSWVVRAIARFKTAEGEAVWSAYGDGAPGNSQMKGAYLRHAETRAAARVLRMATNIGMCSVEEIGPDGATEDDPNGGRAGVAVRVQQERRPAAREQSSGQSAPVHPENPVVGEPEEDPISRVVAEKYPPVGEALCAGRECGRELTMEELRDCAREKLSKPCCSDHLVAYLKKQADKASQTSA